MKPPSIITDDLRRQIIAEPANVSYQEIARKHGVTWYHVKNIRMKAGCHTPQLAPKKAEKISQAIELAEPVTIEGGTPFDRAIEAIEEQIAMFQTALNVLQGMRDLALQGS